MNSEPKPLNSFIQNLSPHLFWDSDVATLDPEFHSGYIITRVMDRGSLDDVKKVWDAYGVEKVREVLTHCRSLNRRTICFFANRFGIEPSSFRAFHGERNWDAA
jgi:hypothetical protein